jgi:hypothetical protein
MSDTKYIVRIHELAYPDGLVWGVFDTPAQAKEALLQRTVTWKGETVRFTEAIEDYFTATLPGDEEDDTLQAYVRPVKLNEWNCVHPFTSETTNMSGDGSKKKKKKKT